MDAESIIEQNRTISESWSREIYELCEFLETVALPVAPVRLNAWTVILNPALFVASHLATVRANMRSRTFLPFLQRLFELKSILSNENTFTNKSETEDRILSQRVAASAA